jgi:hypothetical protein
MWEQYWVIFLGVGNQPEFFILKVMRISFSTYEFSPYKQFSSTNYIRKSRDGCICSLDLILLHLITIKKDGVQTVKILCGSFKQFQDKNQILNLVAPISLWMQLPSAAINF